MPDFEYENRLVEKGISRIAGIDEAGRGSWAGPVVAAAVILDRENMSGALLTGLEDSKKLTAPKRYALFEALQQSVECGVGIASVEEIDTVNILQATFLAMARAVESLSSPPEFALVDGNKVPLIFCPAEAIVKGDSRSLSIAAASILAKTERDAILLGLQEEAGEPLGSGYPGDAITTEWLRRSYDPERGFPHFVRTKWETARRIVEAHAQGSLF